MIWSKKELLTARVVLVLALALTVLPLISLLSAALQPQGEIPRGLRWTSSPNWDNFLDAYSAAGMGRLLMSSLVIVLIVVPVALAFSIMAAYALTRLGLKYQRVILLLLLLGLTLPFESILIPIYYEMQSLGLLNTRLAIALPLIALYMPFATIWMRAHFLNVPKELGEAAMMDGASVWQEFVRVQLPLAKAPAAALGMILFLWTWNEYMLSITLVDDPTKRTMAGALGAFQGQYGTDIVLLSAGTLLTIVPTLLVFLVLQKYFVRALTGAVKG